jgi:hypothetical protein
MESQKQAENEMLKRIRTEVEPETSLLEEYLDYAIRKIKNRALAKNR